MIRQILLSLPTHPDSPPAQTLEGAAVLAQLLGATLTAQIPQLSGNPETWPAVMGTFPLDFPQMMNEAVVRSEKNAGIMAETLAKLCSQMGVSLDIRRSLATLYASPTALVDLARLHDLTILPIPETDSFGRSYVEAAMFDTGRPTLLLPSGERAKSLQRIDTVVVAWDYSRQAARAMADALPILMRANKVHILSVFGEKGLQTTCVPGDLEKYLSSHQVKHVVDQASLKDGTIGDCVMSHAKAVNADLLVMGAYGHSRFREFVLGGATRGVLADPRLPVFLAH